MKKICFILLLMAGTLAIPQLFADLQIVKNGKSEYSVFVVDAKDEISNLASSELISYLKKSTGVELKRNESGKKRIVIGLTPELKKKLGKDLPVHGELRIRTVGNDLYLYGGGKSGNMYAVSAFLEKIVGVRWFTPYQDGTYIPQKKELTVKTMDLREKPGFPTRTMANWFIPVRGREMFYLHHKINNNAMCAKYSDLRQNYAQCHTLFSYIRPNKQVRIWELKWDSKEEKDRVYFKTNPEYFSMNANGKRVPDMQLCFSNPGLRKEFLRRLELQFKKVGAGVYSVSAMDWPGKFCYCDGCQALEKKYQCAGGPLYDFLLEAAEVAKKYPGVSLSTLAYRKGQSEFPPVMKGKFPDNIVIIFAPVDDDVTKTFAHKNNQESYENLKKWAKLAKHVWVWYYVYHDSMEGIVKRVAEDTRLIRQAGATGSFYEFKSAYTYSGVALDEIAVYVALKLFWDPASDWKKHREDYCRYFFGSAADSIIKWMDEREEFTGTIRNHLLWSASSIEWGYYKNTANIIREEKLLEQWFAMTANEPFARENIKRLRLAVDKELLKNYAKVLKIAPEHKGKSQKIFDRMVDDLKSLGKARNIPYARLYKDFAKPLLTKLKIAEIEPAPIPVKELKTTGKQIVRFFPNKFRLEERQMAEAAWKYAYGKEVKDPKAGMPFGYYDAQSKIQKNNKVTFEKIIKDGKFHLYYVTSTKLSPTCRVWAHPSWGLGYGSVGEIFNIDFPDRVWDIYVSLKFTGPAYQKKPETDKNYVWIDQVILVQTKDKPAAPVKTVKAKPVTVAKPITATPYKPKSWQENLSRNYTKLISKYKTTTLLFLGDSITHGWTMSWVKHNGVKVWKKELKKYPAKLNIGLSGDKVGNILWRITEGKQLDGCKARLIILMIGTNNLGRNTPDEIAAGIADILKLIKEKQPGAKVLLLSVLPVSWQMNKYGLINERICKFADDKTVYYLDLAPEFLKKDQKNKTQHLHDGLHPTEEGYRIMANKLIPVIDKILASEKK